MYQDGQKLVVTDLDEPVQISVPVSSAKDLESRRAPTISLSLSPSLHPNPNPTPLKPDPELSPEPSPSPNP